MQVTAVEMIKEMSEDVVGLWVQAQVYLYLEAQMYFKMWYLIQPDQYKRPELIEEILSDDLWALIHPKSRSNLVLEKLFPMIFSYACVWTSLELVQNWVSVNLKITIYHSWWERVTKGKLELTNIYSPQFCSFLRYLNWSPDIGNL